MSLFRSLPYCLLLCFVCLSCGSKPTANKPLVLPEIFIETETGIAWDEYCPCDVFQAFYGDTAVWYGKIKCRGGISSKYEKYSYSLKLTDADSVCRLPANKSWILNASYIDKTFMRHKLCYDLFRMMDERDLAPRCAYAMVYLNHEPRGMYVVMQRLNKHVLLIDERDTNAFIFKEPKVFYTELPPRDTVPCNYHGQKYPDYDEYGDYSSVMDDFRQFIIQSSDEEFADGIGKWVDLQNIIDWHLLILFTNNQDGINKNFYLYKKDTETPFRVALWDCDHSFGRDGDNEMNMMERTAQLQTNIMFERLFQISEYQQSVKERYFQLRKDGIFSYENIYKMVQENDRYVRLGIEKNEALWPYDGQYYYDSNNYEEEVKLLLEFVPLSLQRLDEMFDYR